MNISIIILLIIAALVAFLVSLYNALVKKNIRSEEAWADIDVQLKRRFDLIPNLVETVKGYTKHEKGALVEVVEARSKASSIKIDPATVSAEEMEAFALMQGGVSQGLGKIFALAEAYPDLKANETFIELQKEISDTEDKIQASRRFYNATVRDLNTMIASFPANIFARKLSFTAKEFFSLPEFSPEKEAVKVEF